jgi:molybdopterin-guanine dinucleotide biosynthesis adapter protein
MNMRAMSFVGFHDSGKTTLIAGLAKHLQEHGRRVGIVKSTHSGFDLGLTDTGKLAATGCPVAGISPDQTMILLPRSMRLGALLPLLDVEILLVEGGKSLTFLPRILLPKTEQDVSVLDSGLAYGYWGQPLPINLPNVHSLEVLASLVLERGFLLPSLDCGECGRDNCAGLAREIVAGQALPEECRAQPARFQILVNGVPLGMNTFVASIMSSTIKGMLSPLKGYSPGNIEIHVEDA